MQETKGKCTINKILFNFSFQGKIGEWAMVGCSQAVCTRTKKKTIWQQCPAPASEVLMDEVLQEMNGKLDEIKAMISSSREFVFLCGHLPLQMFSYGVIFL